MNLIVYIGIVSRIADMNRHEYPSNRSGNTGERVYWSSCEVYCFRNVMAHGDAREGK